MVVFGIIIHELQAQPRHPDRLPLLSRNGRSDKPRALGYNISVCYSSTMDANTKIDVFQEDSRDITCSMSRSFQLHLWKVRHRSLCVHSGRGCGLGVIALGNLGPGSL